MCVCVCVCVKERERERGGRKEGWELVNNFFGLGFEQISKHQRYEINALIGSNGAKENAKSISAEG